MPDPKIGMPFSTTLNAIRRSGRCCHLASPDPYRGFARRSGRWQACLRRVRL